MAVEITSLRRRESLRPTYCDTSMETPEPRPRKIQRSISNGLGAGADCRNRNSSAVIAYYQSVHSVIELLKNVADTDGKTEQNNSFHDGALCHVNLFCCAHDKCPFPIYLFEGYCSKAMSVTFEEIVSYFKQIFSRNSKKSVLN